MRAGFIRSGTAAAAGMSETDAAKRTRLAVAARNKLKNLHMFVYFRSIALIARNYIRRAFNVGVWPICIKFYFYDQFATKVFQIKPVEEVFRLVRL